MVSIRNIQYSILLLLLSASLSFSAPADSLHVITHNKTTIVTDPGQGFKLYKKWGVFPEADVPLRKIMMRVKFACPNSMRCADWDYMDRISIARIGGINGTVQDYEIGRMITPYGGAFGKDWKFEWEVDVTDFALLLRDSVEIEYKHTGYEPNNDRGWAITVDFEIIKGKPAYEPVSIRKIYDNSFRYGDSGKSLEQTLKPVSFTAENGAAFARLRMVQTGHGMDEPDGCGEFCNKYREIWFDGKLIYTRSIWKKCGDNPLYPQAGTWLTDRANWCPGNLMQTDLYDLPVIPQKQYLISAIMQSYVSSKPSADEVISAYLIQYKKICAQNDAVLEDVISPSLKPIFSRQNPAAANAQIKVKNLGNNEITSLRIEYGTHGFSKKYYNWKGKFLSGKTEIITLPKTISSKPGNNIFEVTVLKTNGRADSYPRDNFLSMPFAAAPIHTDTVVFYLLTNNQPEQNAYVLKSNEGKTIKERKRGSLKATTAYLDTILLTPGDYTLALSNTSGDGLEFWYNGKGSRGAARLLNAKGDMLKAFESDFGSGWEYNFRVGSNPDPVDGSRLAIGLFPTRSRDKTTLDYMANKPADVLVQLVIDPGGKVVEEHRYNQLREGVFTYDLSRYPKGRFYLKVIVNGEEKFNKRVRYRE